MDPKNSKGSCTIVAIVAAIILVAWIAHTSAIPTVHYVFPDKFRGIARLTFGNASGDVVKLEDGEFWIEFPPNGQLNYGGGDPRGNLESPLWKFQSGANLPEAGSIRTMPKGLVSVVNCGKFNDRSQVFFVGTPDEAKKVDWTKIR